MITEQQFNRFKDADWFPASTESVMIGGAGGIGSWLTFYLSRSGFSPILYDFDTVETHNLGGQLFKASDIGKFKVDAIKRIVKEFCNQDISTSSTEIDSNSMSHHFTFAAFDNMRAREDLFKCWKRSITNCPVTPIFIDGRLLMEQLQIFCVTPENMDRYEKDYLFPDSDVENAPCTLKQTTFSAAMIASYMVSFFANHMSNLYNRETLRTVPFSTELILPFCFSSTKN